MPFRYLLALGSGANLTTGGADFVRATGKNEEIDVHLTPNSPAIDAGTNVAADEWRPGGK